MTVGLRLAMATILLFALSSLCHAESKKLKALIIDGQNNHADVKTGDSKLRPICRRRCHVACPGCGHDDVSARIRRL